MAAAATCANLLACLLFLSATSTITALDFCVADLSSPRTPAGYHCRKPSTVTIRDFVFSGLARPGNTSNLFKAAVTPAFVGQYPGINGLGISAARLDLAAGGVVPLHSHPSASEIILVAKGAITAGLISSDEVTYVKTLNTGEVMVLPKGMLHFHLNAGRGNAVVVSTFSSSDPGMQVTSLALFGNGLPPKIVEATTFIDEAEVERLKKVLGGTNFEELSASVI